MAEWICDVTDCEKKPWTFGERYCDVHCCITHRCSGHPDYCEPCGDG